MMTDDTDLPELTPEEAACLDDIPADAVDHWMKGEIWDGKVWVKKKTLADEIDRLRHPPTGTPENTGMTYTVGRCGPVWEVRCVTRAGGKVTGDQFVAAWPSEQEAEAMVRRLVGQAVDKRCGRLAAERFMEDERDA